MIRALKAGGGSGNIPKVISEIYFTVEDGKENCLAKFNIYDEALKYATNNKSCKEIFMFVDDEVYGGISLENFNNSSIGKNSDRGVE